MKTEKMSLCKSHITHLTKVRNQLKYKQTMSYCQLILGNENNDKVILSVALLEKAISILNTIK